MVKVQNLIFMCRQTIYCRYGGVGVEMIAPTRITLLFPYKNIRNNEKKKLVLSQFSFDLI